jgi:hypothetical protein
MNASGVPNTTMMPKLTAVVAIVSRTASPRRELRRLAPNASAFAARRMSATTGTRIKSANSSDGMMMKAAAADRGLFTNVDLAGAPF